METDLKNFIFLRLDEDLDSLEDIDPDLIDGICQLVKEDSRWGKKNDFVNIEYTFCSNIMKERMAGADYNLWFHDKTNVLSVKSVTKDKKLLKEILKTETELDPNLEQEYQDYHLAIET